MQEIACTLQEIFPSTQQPLHLRTQLSNIVNNGSKQGSIGHLSIAICRALEAVAFLIQSVLLFRCHGHRWNRPPAQISSS